MEILISFFSFFQKAFFAAGPFILLLGILIFIHELGHFLVARFFGVKIEVFSLGFGPKILKYQKGDTCYCLSLLPLGGYVKMFGDNPLEEIAESEKAKGFLYKKVYQKWLIAFAGPFMNLIFTLLAFFLIAKLGIQTLPAQLGDISKNSSAYQQGFRSGDLILSVNGRSISYYKEFDKLLKIGEELSIQLKEDKGEIKNIQVKVQSMKNPNPLDWRKTVGSIEGLSIRSQGLRIGIVTNSKAYQEGLRTFDEIVEVNGIKLRYWRELEFLVEQNQVLSLLVKRESEEQALPFRFKNTKSLSDLGIEASVLYIEKVGPDTPAQRAGLLRGDRLLSIQSEEIKTWDQVLNQIENSGGKPLELSYRSGDEIKNLSITPEPLFVEGNIKTRYMLGIASGTLSAFHPDVLRTRTFLESFIYSGVETGQWLAFISLGLIRLIQGELSLRTMGGPIAIGRMAHSSFSQGFSSFLFMMALISLNLFFLNLLPIPILDGGHILFFTIEGILGRPLSVKKLLVAQQVGLVLILSFMGFAFFNDIYNLFKAW